MKKLFLLTVLLLGFVFGGISAQDRHEGHRDHEAYGHHHRSPYFVSDGKVFFEGRELKDASASNFEILKDGYAKDTWNVYYFGGVINDALSNSFKVLRDGYAKDTWNVYFDGRKIKDASPDSFKVLRDGYAKDTWNTYYYGKAIK